jgi:hypothetical protein
LRGKFRPTYLRTDRRIAGLFVEIPQLVFIISNQKKKVPNLNHLAKEESSARKHLEGALFVFFVLLVSVALTLLAFMLKSTPPEFSATVSG